METCAAALAPTRAARRSANRNDLPAGTALGSRTRCSAQGRSISSAGHLRSSFHSGFGGCIEDSSRIRRR
jgi:hypothetical protein